MRASRECKASNNRPHKVLFPASTCPKITTDKSSLLVFSYASLSSRVGVYDLREISTPSLISGVSARVEATNFSSEDADTFFSAC